MAHRTLGITWDDQVVNVGVVESSFRRFELTGLYTLNREGDEGRRSVAQTIEASIVGRISPTDTVVVTVPGDQVMYETVELPFREPKRVNAALPFQVMDSMPMPVDQLMVDYHVLEHKGKGMKVLAAAVAKQQVEDFLKGVSQEGLDPAVVIPEGFETAVIGRAMGLEGANLVILIQGRRLEMAVFRDSVLTNLRVKGLSQVQTPGNDASPELLREIMVFAAGEFDFTGGNVDRVYVAGSVDGTVVRSIGQALGTEAELLDPEDLEIPASFGGFDQDKHDIRALLMAAFPESVNLRDTVNLRKGSFASAAQYSLLKEKLRLITATVIAFFVLLGVKGYVRYHTLESQYQASLAELRSVSKQLVGKEYEDPDKVLGIMKKQLRYQLDVLPRCPVTSVMGKVFGLVSEAGLASQDLIQVGDSQGTPFAMEVESMRMDESQGYVRCQSETIETMEKFIEGLKAEDCIGGVVTETTERISFRSHEGWQRFSVRFSLLQKPEKKEKSKQGGKGGKKK